MDLLNPGRLWSLWELMNRIDAKWICIRTASFIELQENYERLANTDLRDMAVLEEVFHRQIDFALKECDRLGLDDARKTLNRIKRDLLVLKQLDASALAREANLAAMAYSDNLNKHTCVFIDQQLSRFVDQDALFGEAVSTAFPSAKCDLRDAGNCLAIDANTAAVFHLMRVTELGLRGFCGHLGVREVLDKYDRTGAGQHKYRPIEYAVWEKILGQLKDDVAAKINSYSDHQEKQLAQEFYPAILLEIWAIKEAFRNHVMHARRDYIHEDAVAVMAHVRRLMTKLCERVSEA